MQKRLAIVLIVPVLIALRAHGQLGESPEQCHSRYGVPYAQQGAAGHWCCSRVYQLKEGVLTLRFLSFTTGKVAACWLSFIPSASAGDPAVLKDRFRRGAANTWIPLAVGKSTAAPDKTEAVRRQHEEAIVAQTKVDILRVTGWSGDVRCWSAPGLFAADNGSELVVFSETYMARVRGASPVPPGVTR